MVTETTETTESTKATESTETTETTMVTETTETTESTTDTTATTESTTETTETTESTTETTDTTDSTTETKPNPTQTTETLPPVHLDTFVLDENGEMLEVDTDRAYFIALPAGVSEQVYVDTENTSDGVSAVIEDGQLVINASKPFNSAAPATVTVTDPVTGESYTLNLTTTSDEERGLLGDATLDGVVNAEDAASVLIYAAARGAGEDMALYSAEDGIAEANAKSLADTNGDGLINAEDAANILIYSAMAGADGDADWNAVLGKPEETIE